VRHVVLVFRGCGSNTLFLALQLLAFEFAPYFWW
jgi:hypothetical protein